MLWQSRSEKKHFIIMKKYLEYLMKNNLMNLIDKREY